MAEQRAREPAGEINIWLARPIADALKAAAERELVTKSAIVRQAIAAHLRERGYIQ